MITVSYRNKQMKVEAIECGIVVTYVNTKIEAFIDANLGPKVEGVCGNCNGRQDDSTSVEKWAVTDDSGLQPQG